MTADSITLAFRDYVLSLGPCESWTVADCQGILGAYDLAVRIGGDVDALAQVVSPVALGARIAEARAAPCAYCRVQSAVLSAPAICGACAQEIASP